MTKRHSKRATGSALTILARRESPPNGGCEQFRLGTETIVTSLSALWRTNAFNSPGRTETDLGLWPSQQPCLLRPSLAISEWQINQLKIQAKSVEKSMGEVD